MVRGSIALMIFLIAVLSITASSVRSGCFTDDFSNCVEQTGGSLSSGCSDYACEWFFGAMTCTQPDASRAKDRDFADVHEDSEAPFHPNPQSSFSYISQVVCLERQDCRTWEGCSPPNYRCDAEGDFGDDQGSYLQKYASGGPCP